MRYLVTDYNRSSEILAKQYADEWREIAESLDHLALYIKASDQRGRQGSRIFSPVGTNKGIEEGLTKLGWNFKKAIPKQFGFLGTDIDFVKRGVLVEAQFSNYPFLLNNIQRSELFFKSKTVYDRDPTSILVIVTKCRILPASNSTLYYEQAKSQLDALAAFGVFSIPVRLIGLTVETDKIIEAKDIVYDNARYSRTETEVRQTKVRITQKIPTSRGVIHLV